jgi:hypothetical protein
MSLPDLAFQRVSVYAGKAFGVAPRLRATFNTFNGLLKDPFVPRLLKKVQMQGGVTHPCRMGTRRGARLIPLVVSLSNHAAPRERAGYPSGGWVPADGPFSAA